MALISMLFVMILTMMVLPPLGMLAHRVGLLAYPDARKAHRGAVPQVGGVAIVVSALLGMSVLLPPTPAFVAYLLGALTVFLLGLADDYRELGYRLKFVVVLIAAIFTVATANLAFVPLNDPLPDLPLVLAFPVAVVFLTGVSNAINLVDGLDGLAGGLTLLSCLVLAICGYDAESSLILMITLTLAGAVVGFLRFNTHPARVFMGDNGAFFLGFSLGFVALEVLRDASQPIGLTAVVMMLGVPVVDAMWLPLRRWARGKHLFLSDRSHLHHVLLENGFTHAGTVALIYAFHTLLVVLGYTLRHANELLLLSLYVVIAVVMETSPQLLAPLRRWLTSRRWRLPATESIDRGLDALTLAALLAYVGASVTKATVSGDFVAGAALVLGALLIWWVCRPAAPVGWPERCALYVLGAYVIYLGATPSAGEVVELGAFALIVAWLIYRLLGSAGREFTLTPLDLIVVVTTLCLVLLPGRSLDESAYRIVQLVIWFYAIELLAVRAKRSIWLRAFAGVGLTLIVARGASGILG